MIDAVSDSAGSGADLKKARRQKPAHRSDAGKLDRLPPNSPEAEQGVLGCILLSPNDCLGDCVEKLKDDGKEAFYDLRHQTIYETLTLMFNSRAPIDLITVQQNLKDRQLLEQVGGIAYLAQLQDAVPSAANLAYYLEIVREKFLLRRMIQTCSGVVGKIYDYRVTRAAAKVGLSIISPTPSPSSTRCRAGPGAPQSSSPRARRAPRCSDASGDPHRLSPGARPQSQAHALWPRRGRD